MRRKHRIIILVALLSVVIVGGGGAVYFRQHALDQSALESRELGMAAAEAGNFKDALHQIGSYLQRYGQDKDAEALFEYARARRNIPMTNNKHLGQAIGLFLQVLSIDPNHEPAQLELLDLYSIARYGQETLDLAKRVLDRDPNNVAALSAEAKALAQMRKFDESLERAKRVTELTPLSIEGHLLMLALMVDAGASNTELLAYPDAQEGLDPAGVPYQVVMAVASQLAGNNEEALKWAKKAGENVQPASDNVMLVNNMLNRFNLFQESLALLERVVPVSSDQGLLGQYCQRLFEAGNTTEVLAQTEKLPADSIDSNLLAIRAMAAGRENNTAELEKIVVELEGRSDDAVADAWSPLLRAIWLGGENSPQEVVRLCTSAVESNRANAYFHYFQGLAYEQLGEKEQAISAWQNSVRISPAWIDPILRSASLLAGVGRHAEAFGLVKEALRRAPNSVSVAATGAEIIGANIDGLSDSNQKQLLLLCEQVQSARPQEPRTLPLMIALLARQGDTDGATSTLRSALESDSTLPENTLLKFVELSNRYELGLADACFAKLHGDVGMTPSLAFAEAVSSLKKGDPEKGRQLITEGATNAGNTLPWQIVTAQFLELSNSDEATTTWATIAEHAEGDASLLRRVLDSRAAWKDTELIDRVIDQLKSITGESAVTWRAARARWLLLTDTSQRSAAEAASLLNDTMRSTMPDAGRYALLATALERLSNTQGAIDSLQQAAQIAPENVGLQFELVRMLLDRGQSDQATGYLDNIAKNPSTSGEDRHRAAALLARVGRTQDAIDALLAQLPEDDRDVPLDLLLAQLYRRSGQTDKAEAICQRFLQEAPDARVIEFTADMLASQDRIDEAKSVLTRLDSLQDLSPGMREMILAEFDRFHGPADEAERWYDAAIAVNPENSVVWHRMLAFLVRTGDVARALERLPEAAAACTTDESLNALLRDKTLVERLQSRPMAVPFILAAIEAPQNTTAAIEALNAIDQTTEVETDNLVGKFRALSDEHPEFLTLKMQLVRMYASLNRHDDAAALATEAMRDFPTEIEPALLAAEAHAANQDWIAALSAARQWRERSPGNPDAADLLIATAQISLDRSSEALDTIRPYVSDADQDPTQYSPMLANQARALIKSGQEALAAELLQPRLETASPWRMLWLQLALFDIPSDAVAIEWIDKVAPVIPNDSLNEQLALANAWFDIARRTQDPAHKQKAVNLIETLAKRPDVDGKTMFALAVSQELDGNNEAAEANYLRALEIDPNLTPAKNNLAMRYVTENKKLEEALKLAQEIVAAAPSNANFHDTLSQVYEKLGNLDGAIQSAQEAAKLQPKNPQWNSRVEQLGLAKEQTNTEAPQS